jgi:hypothetical protein
MHGSDAVIQRDDAAGGRRIVRSPRRRLRLLGTLLVLGAAAMAVGIATGRGVRSIVERARERADAMLGDAHLVSGRVSEATQVVGETAASLVEGPDPAHVVDPTEPPTAGPR